ncbi:hypothetical protein LPJ61_006043 [Coemansia biformis]|uniref:FAS1 domain-containing protein n=1 Tax=Coemansia biformis TaxID=1286918 RepID=A0A9W7XYM2_9FUNG|nr:hypothetical protein LPJ61_006043 [Coemansia biformis]
MGAQGPPALSDIIAQEKSASIAVDAIFRSEDLVRAISGDSADFGSGLTLLLPTNRAFRSLGSLPDDIERVMKRHFIPQVVTLEQMARGAAVPAYQALAVLRFSSSHGKPHVQADQRPPVEVRGAGTHASSGTYYLVDELFV